MLRRSCRQSTVFGPSVALMAGVGKLLRSPRHWPLNACGCVSHLSAQRGGECAPRTVRMEGDATGGARRSVRALDLTTLPYHLACFELRSVAFTDAPSARAARPGGVSLFSALPRLVRAQVGSSFTADVRPVCASLCAPHIPAFSAARCTSSPMLLARR